MTFKFNKWNCRLEGYNNLGIYNESIVEKKRGVELVKVYRELILSLKGLELQLKVESHPKRFNFIVVIDSQA